MSLFVDGGVVFCPLCGEPGFSVGTRNGYELAKCKACRHFFAVDVPSEDVIRSHYAVYSYETSGRFDAIPDFVHLRLRQIARELEPFARLRKVLDVGFGAGACMMAFAREGWEAHGIELSRAAALAARARGLPRAIEGDFLRAPYTAGSFDVITMIEVIEHIPQPVSYLEQAARLLRPGGALYLTTPNGDGVSAKLLGTAWSVAEPPEHLHLFSPRSLLRAAARAGFKRCRVRSEGVNPSEIVYGLRGFVGERGSRGPKIDRVAAAQALNAALLASSRGRFFRRVANEVLSRTRLGDGLKVLARTSDGARGECP